MVQLQLQLQLRKVPFEDKSGAETAAQRKVDREASDASSQASKEF